MRNHRLSEQKGGTRHADWIFFSSLHNGLPRGFGWRENTPLVYIRTEHSSLLFHVIFNSSEYEQLSAPVISHKPLWHNLCVFIVCKVIRHIWWVTLLILRPSIKISWQIESKVYAKWFRGESHKVSL